MAQNERRIHLTDTKKFFKDLQVTNDELDALNKWIKEGYSFYMNPLHIHAENGDVLNYIEGIRVMDSMYQDYSDYTFEENVPSDHRQDDEFPF